MIRLNNDSIFLVYASVILMIINNLLIILPFIKVLFIGLIRLVYYTLHTLAFSILVIRKASFLFSFCWFWTYFPDTADHILLSEYVECSTYLDQQISEKTSTLNLNRLFYRSELTEKINNLAMERQKILYLKSRCGFVPFGPNTWGISKNLYDYGFKGSYFGCESVARVTTNPWWFSLKPKQVPIV